MRRRSLLAAALGAVPVAATWSRDYSSRPVRAVVGFPPGGGTDPVARPMTQGIQAPLGQSVVVDNRGGANGRVGLEAVAKSAPDGRTIDHVNSSVVLTNPLFYRNRPSMGSATSRRSAPWQTPRWSSLCRRTSRRRTCASSWRWPGARPAGSISVRADWAASITSASRCCAARPAFRGRSEMATLIGEETAKWAAIIGELNIRLD